MLSGVTHVSTAANTAANRDVQAVRREYYIAPPAFVRRTLVALLNDERDSPLLYAYLNIVCITLPSALAVLLLNRGSHLWGALHVVVNYALFLQRFMLALHYSEHRKLFRKEYGVLNHAAPVLLSVLFGVPCGMYRYHHCIMHHVEENRAGWDASSTESYQRDNLFHFLIYWMKYWIATWVDLPLYLARKGRVRAMLCCLAMETAYLGGVAAAWRWNAVATLWVFIIPFFISSFALMLGNWSQHAFINAAMPNEAYGAAYNCIDCDDNARTFNDGYHVEHHRNSRAHWSQLPHLFLQRLHEYDEHDVLVFHKLGFFDIGIGIFTGQLEWLARHAVPCGPRQASRSTADVVKLLRARLRPVSLQTMKSY